MALHKTDGMETISVAEWNRRQAIRTIRNRIIVQIAKAIIGVTVIAVVLYILNDMRIINLRWW